MAVGNVLLVEYLGIKLLPLSFGLLLFMNGIAGIIFFTVTGLLNDVAGNYTVTYWAIGSVVTIPGFLWLSINCFNYEKPHELDSAE
ncbi:hypothetical protein SK128_015740 [Halocaridina rubra]|uniref:Uncharacterized protein n=1 Tax=Halocaridina rubra TaxID=373956 RepID=A0AAN8XCU4_HALRR